LAVLSEPWAGAAPAQAALWERRPSPSTGRPRLLFGWSRACSDRPIWRLTATQPA